MAVSFGLEWRSGLELAGRAAAETTSGLGAAGPMGLAARAAAASCWPHSEQPRHSLADRPAGPCAALSAAWPAAAGQRRARAAPPSPQPVASERLASERAGAQKTRKTELNCSGRRWAVRLAVRLAERRSVRSPGVCAAGSLNSRRPVGKLKLCPPPELFSSASPETGGRTDGAAVTGAGRRRTRRRTDALAPGFAAGCPLWRCSRRAS